MQTEQTAQDRGRKEGEVRTAIARFTDAVLSGHTRTLGDMIAPEDDNVFYG